MNNNRLKIFLVAICCVLFVCNFIFNTENVVSMILCAFTFALTAIALLVSCKGKDSTKISTLTKLFLLCSSITVFSAVMVLLEIVVSKYSIAFLFLGVFLILILCFVVYKRNI